VRFALPLFACLLVLTLPLACAASLPAPKVAQTDTLAVGPTVDGDLADPCWAKAAVLQGWSDSETGLPAANPVEAKVSLDTSRLYLAFRCWESRMDLLRVKETRDGENVGRDECLEVFFSNADTGGRYYHLQLNPNGARHFAQEGWGREIQTACRLLADGWQAEVAIPLSVLGIDRLASGVGCRWRFNVNRQRRLTDGTADDYNWNCLYGRWGDVSRFGILQANPRAPVSLERWAAPAPRWGAGNRCSFVVRAAQACTVRCGAGARSGMGTVSAHLQPGERRELRLAYTTTLTSPEARAERLRAWVEVNGERQLAMSTPLALPPVAGLFLQEPNYRGYLWPDTRQVRGFLELGLTPEGTRNTRFTVAVRAGEREYPARLRVQGQRLQFSLPADGILVGAATLVARAVDRSSGRTLFQATTPLRRFSTTEQAALPAYIDRYNRLIVQGKPFFPLGWYSDRKVRNLEEMKAGGFNCALDYGINHMQVDEIKAYLDAAERLGMRLIYCNNDLYPSLTQGKTKGPWQGSQIVEGIVDTFKDHPAIIAWYLNDERPPSMLPELTDYYDRVRAHDPGHPAYIVHCDMDVLDQFYHTTDVMGVDPYPMPNGFVSEVARWAEVSRAAAREIKPTWLVPQAFGWYQYREPLPGSMGGRGRIPTGEELRTGREPTYEEERAMTWLALNHGAKGLIYYCYYDNRVLPHHREHFAGMTRIAGEINQLMPVLLTTEQVARSPFSCADEDIDLGVWRHQGAWYLAAVNTSREPQQATLRGPFGGKVEVLFENGRVVSAGARSLVEQFAPLEVHLYRIG